MLLFKVSTQEGRPPEEQAMSFDIVIKNGMVMDGTGNPWYHADIGIEGDRIKTIGRINDGTKTIDASGHIVTPGFIDIHTHTDLPILIDPKAQSKIRQGVTTEVIGMCGESAAPMNDSLKQYRLKYNASGVPDGFSYDWSSMDSYMNRVDRQGAAVNIAPVVGHGTVRQNILGYESREPSGDELAEMKSLVREAMEHGAWGMSTGLIYPPSAYGKQPEITELAKVVAEYGGLYFSHIRDEGKALIEAVTEACEIGKDSKSPVQIAHFKAKGKPYWGRTTESLALVRKFRETGVDVTFDQYPYTASSTNLTALLPHWSQEGGAEKLMEYLQNPAMRKKMAGEWQFSFDWTDIQVANAKNNPEYNGRNIQEIGEMMGREPQDAYFDLLVLENTQVPAVMFLMNEDDLRGVMQSPYGMVGSDGSAIAPDGMWANYAPHPRFYGTFPRVLSHYVRDEGVITLQEAVRKMTGAPAQKLGFKDRGILREGYKADITILDPDKVKDMATFTKPQQYPAGIPYVFVNGEAVIENGVHTGALPGKALRKR